MVNKIIILFSSIALLLIASCHSTSIPDYMTMVTVKNEDFRKQKSIDELTIEVLCKPAAYSSILEGGVSISAREHEELKNEFSNSVNFNLRIGPSHGNQNVLAYKTSSKEGIDNRIRYFSYHFENDIRLQQGELEFKPILYHFERSYDLTPHKGFTLSFPKSNSHEDYTLVINSKELGLYNVKFRFDKSKIDNSPQLIF